MQPSDSLSMRDLPAAHAAPGLYAGFWRRVAAVLIDALILGAAQVVVTVFFGSWLLVPWAMLGGGDGIAMARLIDIGLQPLGFVLAWLYFATCESSRWQATIGKRALGLRVTDAGGRRIGFARASGRHFGKFISALLLCTGFLLAGWTARRQALHDRMAGCCVVRRRGLAAWRGTADPAATPANPRKPAWVIALVALAGCGVLAIPALVIVGALLLPAYASHVARTQVWQGIAATERPRALVAEYMGVRGKVPGSNADLGLPRPETLQARYVSRIGVTAGKVVVTYGNDASPAIRGGHVVVSPSGNVAKLQWFCSSPDIQERYLPAACR